MTPVETLLAANDLDQDRLAEILVGAGLGNHLAGFRPELVGTGQVGENVRCHLTWQGDEPGSPDSVILKLPSSDPTSRATGAATRSYIREVGFYRDVAPGVGIRVPAIHHHWEDRPTNRFLLVMEDIHPAETGDQLTGCTPAQAELAVDAIAALHGSTWTPAALASHDWVDVPDPEGIEGRSELYAALLPGFVDRYRDRLEPEELVFGRWLADHTRAWQEARSQPQCLVHGDFRLDNVLFGAGPPAPPITTVDWQTVSLGRALADVAYFLSACLPPAKLEPLEAGLLSRYRAELSRWGVELTADQVDQDYRLAAPAGYMMAVIASQLVGQTERGDEMFLVMAKGAASLARRLDTASLLI